MSETDAVASHQKALFTALSGVISAPVYDGMPDSTAYPFVVIDKHQAINQDNLGNDYELVMTYISVWSDYHGQKEVLDIMNEIRGALHRMKLTLDTGNTVINRVVSRETIRDQDNKTYQGRVRIQSLIET